MSSKGPVMLSVKGQDALEAVPALFSNFLAVSRVGTEIQFEFIFLDLNQIALLLQKGKGAENSTPPALVGKTVAKVVMPAAAFIQLKDHINGLFSAIEEALAKPSEVEHVRSRTGSE